MRVETEATNDVVENPRPKVFMTDEEYRLLRRSAESNRDELMIRLGGEVGLRSFEVPQEKPKHVRRSEDGEHYFLRVPRGKDTSGTGGKPRDAFLPRDLETRLHRYARDNEIGDDEAYFPYSPRWVQERVKLAAKNAYEESGDEDWLKVSSHDLRVYFGHTMLVEERMNPEVVMDVGGWEDYESIKPYLGKPSEKNIISEFERVGRA